MALADKLKALAKSIAELEKQFGKGIVMRYGSEPAVPCPVVPTGSVGLDLALGIGGLPRGRIVELFGPEACLAADTFIQYELRSKDGQRHNHKGGTIERLYERFHDLPPSGDGRGKYKRLRTEGADFFAPCMNEEGRIFQNRVEDVMWVGERHCLEMVTRTGRRIVATPEHKFWNGERFLALEELAPGLTVFIHNNTPYTVAEDAAVGRRDRVYLYVKNHPVAGIKVVNPNSSRSEGRGYEYHYYRLLRSRAVVEARMNGLLLDEYVARLNDGQLDGLRFLDREDHVHHKNENVTDDSPENLVVISAAEHGKLHALERHNNLRFAAIPDVVESVAPVGVRTVYDVRMQQPFNNFVAAGFVIHNSGKTTLALHVIAETQRAGGICAFVDAEHALDITYAQNIGVVVEQLLVSQPDCGEQALEVAVELVKSGSVDLIVIDSVAALTPRAEIEGEMGEAHMGLHARLMSQAMRKLCSICSKHGTMVLFINQLRMKIGVVVFGNPEVTTGGNALKFYASVRLDVRKIASLSEKAEGGEKGARTGNRVRVKVVKNKMATPFKEAEFDIRFGEGIDALGELIDLAIAHNIMEKAGSWYALGGDRIGQGRDAVRAYLEEHPDVASGLRETLRAKLAPET